MADDDRLDRLIVIVTDMAERLTDMAERLRRVETTQTAMAERQREDGVAISLILDNQTTHARAIRGLQQDVRELRNDFMRERGNTQET
ncbi:MAG TPA: hypothetical protein VHT52_17155 [Stellaceae bacterium]|jgi:hypothetical protein|nr:hypothetical protein [Stellaceae bacterium]